MKWIKMFPVGFTITLEDILRNSSDGNVTIIFTVLMSPKKSTLVGLSSEGSILDKFNKCFKPDACRSGNTTPSSWGMRQLCTVKMLLCSPLLSSFAV